MGILVVVRTLSKLRLLLTTIYIIQDTAIKLIIEYVKMYCPDLNKYFLSVTKYIVGFVSTKTINNISK